MIRIDVHSLDVGPTKVLQDFRINTDARSVLIGGRVGSGKSLLARALCGDFADSDWIKLEGEVQLAERTFRLPLRAQDELPRIGYLPQNSTNFFISSSVENELLTSQFCSAASAALARGSVERWRAESPLADRALLPPLALSGGQQRLFVLETLLATAPDHLVLDGGMIALDPNFRRRARDLIQAWLDQDPRRRLISFSSSIECSWFNFGLVTSISDHQDRARPTPPASKTAGNPSTKDVLVFKSISAGPLISGRPLIRNASLAVKEGAYVGLRGENGVGKSTLLRLVAGIKRPTEGEIYFVGRPLRKIRWNGLRDGVGYLPQEPELAGPTIVDAREKPRDQQIVEFWQEFFQLSWFEDGASYWSLSSGERSRATLMFQAAFRPRLWILDEPTSRIGAQEAAAFLHAARRIDPHVCGVIVSHDDSFLNEVTDAQYDLTPDGIKEIVGAGPGGHTLVESA